MWLSALAVALMPVLALADTNAAGTATEEANLQRLGGKSTEAQIEITSWTTGVLVFLVVLWALFGPKLGRFYLTEGSAACLLGLCCGLLLLAMKHYIVQQAVVQKLLAFSAASFFTYLLPPVIFYAGLSIEKTLFFSNLGSILALGVVGTAFAALLLAVFLAAGFAGMKLLRLQDCLALGAIFSATDSVATLQVLNPERQPVLFSLVFGEGVINDATSVVLLGAVSTIFPQGAGGTSLSPPDPSAGSGWDQMGSIALTFIYLFLTSLALGAATGMGISCLVVRFAAHGPHHEVALIGLLSYLSYLAAEVLGLSGILSLFCCGLTVSHFALDGISPLGRTTTLNAFHTMSYICEGIIFIYLGMDALDPAKWNAAHPGEAVSLCGALLLLLLVARGASVLPITALHNWLHSVKLSSTDIVIIWWSGLMRGAVSVALAYYYFDIGSPTGTSGDSHRSTLIAATLVVVLTSVMVLGALTTPLMQFLVDEPELGLLEKITKALRESKTHARGWTSDILSSICCCFSGRAMRGRGLLSRRLSDAARTGGRGGSNGHSRFEGGSPEESSGLLSHGSLEAGEIQGEHGDLELGHARATVSTGRETPHPTANGVDKAAGERRGGSDYKRGDVGQRRGRRAGEGSDGSDGVLRMVDLPSKAGGGVQGVGDVTQGVAGEQELVRVGGGGEEGASTPPSARRVSGLKPTSKSMDQHAFSGMRSGAASGHLGTGPSNPRQGSASKPP